MSLNAIPPTALVLLSVFSVQLGAGIATELFPFIGATGTVAVRIIIAAIILALVARIRLLSLKTLIPAHLTLYVGYGLCIAAMNFFFYLSISLLPLGAAVAIEFAGPLGVAAFKSKRLIHFFWVAVAALGILLLTPLTGVSLDPLGILYALIAGSGWALFILLSERVNKFGSGNDSLVIGMTIAAIAMIPFALPVVGTLFINTKLLLLALAVALLSTAIPFSFEFEALKTLPAHNYGILVSVEPAVAALIGALLLGDLIGTQGTIAIACVVAAAVGISFSDKKRQP